MSTLIPYGLSPEELEIYIAIQLNKMPKEKDPIEFLQDAESVSEKIKGWFDRLPSQAKIEESASYLVEKSEELGIKPNEEQIKAYRKDVESSLQVIIRIYELVQGSDHLKWEIAGRNRPNPDMKEIEITPETFPMIERIFNNLKDAESKLAIESLNHFYFQAQSPLHPDHEKIYPIMEDIISAQSLVDDKSLSQLRDRLKQQDPEEQQLRALAYFWDNEKVPKEGYWQGGKRGPLDYHLITKRASEMLDTISKLWNDMIHGNTKAKEEATKSFKEVISAIYDRTRHDFSYFDYKKNEFVPRKPSEQKK